MTGLAQDFRYAQRQLRKNPGFTAVAVITLAFGIGANTAVFTLVHAVLIKSLPVVNPRQLYRLGDNNNYCCVVGGNIHAAHFAIFSYPLYLQLRDQNPDFEQMAAFQASTTEYGVRRVPSSAPAVALTGEYVSGNYFSTFGVQAWSGRVLTPSDDQASALPAVVISYRTWQQRYGHDQTIVGASLTINGAPFTVVGVTPPGFYGDTLRSDPPDMFIPLADEPLIASDQSLLRHADLHWLYIIGRLKANVGLAALQAKLQTQLQDWMTDQAGTNLSQENRNAIARTTLRLTVGDSGITSLREQSLDALRLLIAVAALVLIIACANLANLLLARGAGQRQQTSVRMALGASRSRLIRQALTESVLLAVAGGAASLLVGFAVARTILALAFHGSMYVPIDPTPSLPILEFALVLSLLTGVIFGIAPAWWTSRLEPADVLRGAGRTTQDHPRLLQKALVVAQTALSVVLLAGAGLLLRSLTNLEQQHFGFETQNRLAVKVNPSLGGYQFEKLPMLYRAIASRIGEVPGVMSVSYAQYGPLDGDRWSSDVYFEDGRTRAKQGDEDYGVWDRVGTHYFETMGTPLLRGRAMDERDTPDSARVAVVNQSFVRRYFPNEEPIGKRFGSSPHNRSPYQIIGVVEDAKYTDAWVPAEPMVFLPFFQSVDKQKPELDEIRSNYIQSIVLRLRDGAQNVAPLVRQALAEIDPNLPVTAVQTLQEQVDRNFNQERLTARLTVLFGILAVALASLGLYGVTSYSVSRRTNEIGVRMAIGADRISVVAMVLRSAWRQIGLGLVIGVPTALAAGRLLASRLYNLATYDPLVLCLAVLVLSVCGSVAGFIPARRAAKVDPMVALRSE
ncbi:MAG TPA: ABC transporter permease [Terriglobales bacterium]|nr:ABC transporter permease [Terriglobales bacterium]